MFEAGQIGPSPSWNWKVLNQNVAITFAPPPPQTMAFLSFSFPQQAEQLAKMKEEAAKHHEEEISHHEDSIGELQVHWVVLVSFPDLIPRVTRASLIPRLTRTRRG